MTTPVASATGAIRPPKVIEWAHVDKVRPARAQHPHTTYSLSVTIGIELTHPHIPQPCPRVLLARIGMQQKHFAYV
jgi:hypothetical protein